MKKPRNFYFTFFILSSFTFTAQPAKEKSINQDEITAAHMERSRQSYVFGAVALVIIIVALAVRRRKKRKEEG